ncbi:MAG: DUF2147 domain-containing protein, partial [Alphaproteobacteria bacterium]|nr:DUF2147 domain-containing protein [Alphaproteobacteria bacterium]
LLVVAGLQSQSDGTWDEGRIYDPKVGRSYNVAVERIGADRLRVTGYIGAKLFGKSFIWRRAPDGLEKCSASG